MFFVFICWGSKLAPAIRALSISLIRRISTKQMQLWLGLCCPSQKWGGGVDSHASTGGPLTSTRRLNDTSFGQYPEKYFGKPSVKDYDIPTQELTYKPFFWCRDESACSREARVHMSSAADCQANKPVGVRWRTGELNEYTVACMFVCATYPIGLLNIKKLFFIVSPCREAHSAEVADPVFMPY